MKTFTFRFAPMRGSLSKRLLQAAKSRKIEVRDNELLCSNYKDLLEVATESRLEILRVIAREKPTSLYELAKLLDKDQSYVLKEAKILAGMGIIQLKKEKSGSRERLRPVPLFDNVVIDCGISNDEEAV